MRDPARDLADVYILHREAGFADRWGPAQEVNLPIGVRSDVRSAFLAADGKSLYFSTNGLSGEGGYDLYVCRRTGSGWEDPAIPSFLHSCNGSSSSFAEGKSGVISLNE